MRKSSVRIVDGLAVSCASSLKKFWVMYVDLLVERFSERDTNVKVDILQAFQNLIKASVYADSDLDTLDLGNISMMKKASSNLP